MVAPHQETTGNAMTLLHPTAPNPNTYANNPLDRVSHLRADLGWLSDRLRDPDSRIVPFWQLHPFILAAQQPQTMAEVGWLRPGAIALGAEETTILLGLDRDGAAYFAHDISGWSDPERQGPLAGLGSFEELRGITSRLDRGDAAILAQGKAMIDWHARHRFCANCGAPTTLQDAGYRRLCDGCGTEHFPRTDPVVIMLAVRGDRALLGRQPRFPPRMYSALAGFVEPGESIEEAVAREVYEEAGIRVGAVRYHSTQPWPFPSSLMIGCIAEADSEEITIDGNELEEARWFEREQLRDVVEGRGGRRLLLPPPLAIAHQLIRWWCLED
jgi:NAD+ diphosphatase